MVGLQWPDIDLEFDTEMVDVLRRWKVAQLEESLRAGMAWEISVRCDPCVSGKGR